MLDGLDELHREHLPWLFRTPATQARSRDYFEQLLSGDDSCVLVADAGEVVGVVIALMRSTPDFQVFIPQRWGILDSIVVSPPLANVAESEGNLRTPQRGGRVLGVVAGLHGWMETILTSFA